MASGSDIFGEQPATKAPLSPAPLVLIPIAAAVIGYTEKAIRSKIERGHWLHGREYFKAPDGHIFISIQAVCEWVRSGPRR